MYEEDDVLSLIRKALEEDNIEEAEEIVDSNEDTFDGDIREAAFRIAVQTACYSYVEDHYEDVELNDVGCGECSSYLHETEDEDIIELLTSLGAFRSWDEYEDYKFAVETVNGSVLAFDADFQREVFNKLLEKIGMEEQEVAELLESGEAEECTLPEGVSGLDMETLQDACDILLVSSDGENISLGEFDYMDDSVQGWTLRELVENLGWNCDFEGESWKFETNGVYFIKE